MTAESKNDYRDTVFLPTTDFPMRGNLPKREPDILAMWEDTNLFQRLRKDSQGRERYILHDGPPYANGALHLGTALNKTLKDMINRAHQMSGYDAHYVPGWDCHGLPIEWEVEKQIRAEGKNKDDLSPLEIRKRCRAFAEHWIDIQRNDFKRLGVMGRWEDPYLTMAPASEARIVREIHTFAQNGGLYRGLKSVMWSVVEETALAEAEVEYQEHVSTQVWVRFPVRRSKALPKNASVVIWTTTPWTLPANKALAVNPETDYAVVTVAHDRAGAKKGDVLVFAADCLGHATAALGVDLPVRTRLRGQELVGTVCAHPLAEQGFDHEVPILPGDFVTTEQGSGIVHIAPAHGADDFALGKTYDLPQESLVAGDGVYTQAAHGFAGLHIFKAADPVCDALGAHLLSRAPFAHSYPHSWRSKAPLIYMTSPQWFISMETNDLRDKALAALAQVTFTPRTGRERLSAMIRTRPDWCISRQRTWGVPIALFVHKDSGEILTDPDVLKRIQGIIADEGSDAWFARPAQDFLGDGRRAQDFEQVMDIVDVWFESGSSHAFVLEDDPKMTWPADLYLEGSDQHRGWFHSSLLEASGTRGKAPFKGVLTHGFVVDAQGRKMSKSLRNNVSPYKIIDRYGADILRLWVVASDHYEDLRVSEQIFGAQADAYRRIRNTLRYLLGAAGDVTDRTVPEDLPQLERYLIHRLSEMDEMVRSQTAALNFHQLYTEIYNFCVNDLSALYLEVRKDLIYCGAPDDPARIAARAMMAQAMECVLCWLAPILPFTCEDAWQSWPHKPHESIHEALFPTIDEAWRDPALADRWHHIRQVRRVITGALEVARKDKRLGSSLQAAPIIYLSRPRAVAMEGVADLDWAELAITSAAQVEIIDPWVPPEGAFVLPDTSEVAVRCEMAQGNKCGRCWKVNAQVGQHQDPNLCTRCAGVVGA